MSVDFSVCDTASVVDLDDVHDARSVAVLCIPPGSTVIAFGLRDDAVARALAGRQCRVWALETDSERAAAAAPWCEGMLQHEGELTSRESTSPPTSVEFVLFLDALKYPDDPTPTLWRVIPWLAHGGRLVLEMSRNGGGAERHRLYERLEQLDVHVIEEIQVHPSMPDGERRPSVVAVAVRAHRPPIDVTPSLASTLMERLHRGEEKCRWLQECTSDLERQIERHRTEQAAARAALDEARERHRQSAESVATLNDAIRRSEAERQHAEAQLATTTRELTLCQYERRFLRDDVAVKDAYLATLREEIAVLQRAAADRDATLCQTAAQHGALQQAHAEERQRVADEMGLLHQRVADSVASREAETRRAETVAVENNELVRQLEATRLELHRVHVAIAATMAQPRFVIAERLNDWLKRIAFLHAPLKRAWLARHR